MQSMSMNGPNASLAVRALISVGRVWTRCEALVAIILGVGVVGTALCREDLRSLICFLLGCSIHLLNTLMGSNPLFQSGERRTKFQAASSPGLGYLAVRPRSCCLSCRQSRCDVVSSQRGPSRRGRAT